MRRAVREDPAGRTGADAEGHDYSLGSRGVRELVSTDETQGDR